MRSRYDLMSTTETQDNGKVYKDPFTLPLQKFVYRENTIEVTLDSTDLKRPDYLGSKLYGSDEMEDFVLMLNNIGLLQYSTAGDSIDVPTNNDMESFYFKYRV